MSWKRILQAQKDAKKEELGKYYCDGSMEPKTSKLSGLNPWTALKNLLKKKKDARTHDNGYRP